MSEPVATVIYGLLDPASGELRYVGKTTASLRTRLNGHISDVTRGRVYIPRHKWIARLLSAGMRPEIIELETVADAEWQEAEKFWIAYCRFLGCALLNATAGGDGLASYRTLPETRAKQSVAAKLRYADPEERRKTGAAVRLGYVDEQARANLRVARKRMPNSVYEGVRRWARSEANKARAAAMCKARAGKPMSDETKRKLSIARTGSKRSPESVEKSAAGHRGRKNTAETKAKMSAAAKARYERARLAA